MKSPATELREKWSVSRSQMALILNVSIQQWCGFESGGSPLPRAAWAPLRELHVDPGALDLAQREWRAEQSKLKRRELAERLARELRLAESSASG